MLGDLAAHTDDLDRLVGARAAGAGGVIALPAAVAEERVEVGVADAVALSVDLREVDAEVLGARANGGGSQNRLPMRSEEHTSELQSLMRISYAVFCLKKKKKTNHNAVQI